MQKMTTWQILPDAGNHFRWAISGADQSNGSQEPSSRSAIHRESNPNSSLPSMVDLLSQGSSKLFQSSGEPNERTPMFRTGFGKSVAVKQSSILKALSVLGEDDVIEKDYSKPLKNNSSSSSSSFKCSPLFQTGSGKSVAVKQSSILKALSVLGGDDAIENELGQLHDGEDVRSFSNSLFQTGSGKKVNVSSAGLMRAQTLLCLDEDSHKFIADESKGYVNPLHSEGRMFGDTNGAVDSRSVPTLSGSCQTGIHTPEHGKVAIQNLPGSEMCSSTSKQPQIKFQTAGGRSISVSNNALQRAKSLLGDSELGNLQNEGGANSSVFPFCEDSQFDKTNLNKENDPYVSCLHQGRTKKDYASLSFPPPKVPISKQKQLSTRLNESNTGANLLKKFDAYDLEYDGAFMENGNLSCIQKPSTVALPIFVENSLAKDVGSRMKPMEKASGGPLVDISNHNGRASSNQTQINCEKRKLGRRSSVSPFKRPRCSRFSTPLETSAAFIPNGSVSKSEVSSCKTKVSARYPCPIRRATMKEHFGVSPSRRNLLEIQDIVKNMNPESAESYMFHEASSLKGFGVDSFRHMLGACGASMVLASKEYKRLPWNRGSSLPIQYFITVSLSPSGLIAQTVDSYTVLVTKKQKRDSVNAITNKWVANHYKWIVWKLACYERWYSHKGTCRYLTVPNVLEELKYRYEREVNHSHRSALKRIMEGDASPASMVILCISAIHLNQELEKEHSTAPSEDVKKIGNFAQIELTDGWYSLNAILDVQLSKLLVAGELFVGQKLRIWRAALCGWAGPVSPLEASKSVSLLLHINGTYKAHWADRMGFCKELGAPLAFRCIKGDGGLVPKTLVGVIRIYPMLYKERLSDGGSIVRSDRMETKALQLYNESRSSIAEGIMSEFEMGISSHRKADNDSEEGAKIFKILEKAAEPEVIMAGMSTAQLTSFATYQAKQEALRQSDMQKKIEEALEDAGISERKVTPFLRVRVVGLTSKHSQGKRNSSHREGLITIWNPTDKQQCELIEGHAYDVAGLTPLKYESDILYLQARGSTTPWRPLPPLAVSNFESFFIPRKSILLSGLGEVPLASEFDIAAVVVYVGEPYIAGQQKKQWVFITDDSMSGSEESSTSLLAISFCSPNISTDSSAPINCTLAGSTVGFCNLVKRARDQMNNLWVAEATDNSTYSFCYELPACSHLKQAATSAYKWAKISSLTIQKLRERVLSIIGDGVS